MASSRQIALIPKVSNLDDQRQECPLCLTMTSLENDVCYHRAQYIQIVRKGGKH